MSILEGLLVAAIAFGALAVVFRALELTFPARRQAFRREHWRLDLLYFLGQYCLWGVVVTWAVHQIGDHTGGLLPVAWREAVARQPVWLQAIEVFALSDLCIYWGHRLQHSWSFLWRFHSIHHSATRLDWLAAHREHPLDSIYTITLINLPAMVLGFPLETVAGFIAFRGLWAIYIHSNVRVRTPLRWLLGAPELHHWHHDKDRRAGNYANLSPLMDLAFGTYVCPDREPEAFGVDEAMPQGYLQQLWHPFRPRRSE